MTQHFSTALSLLPAGLLTAGLLTAGLLTAGSCTAQVRGPAGKPKRVAAVASPQAALALFAKAAKLPERQRASAVQQLARFSTKAVNEVLIRELRRAKDPTYLRSVVSAIGRRPRAGALPPLLAWFDGKADFSLRYSLANAIARQGDPGVDALLKRLKGNSTDTTRRSSILSGLSSARTKRAWQALIEAAGTGTERDRAAAMNYLRSAPKSDALIAVCEAGAKSSDQQLQLASLSILVRHKHSGIKASLLEVYTKQRKKLSGFYAVQLAEMMWPILDADLFAPMLDVSARGYRSIDRFLKQALTEVDKKAGLVPWLLKNGVGHKGPTERVIAIRMVAASKSKAVTDTLIGLLGSKTPGIASLAIEALTKRGDKEAVPFLRRGLKSRDLLQRLEALQGLHTLLKDEPGWRKELLGFLKKKDPRQKALVLDLLAEQQNFDVLPEVYKLLKHKQWVVRAAAYDYCRTVRSLKSVDPLIARLDKENGRLREDCLDALKAITSYRMFDSGRWREWWKESRATFKMPTLAQALPKKKKGSRGAAGTVTSFFDIPIVSQQAIFVLDISGSMSARIGTGSGGVASGRTRLDEAKRQLTNVIKALKKQARFNLIYFESGVRAFQKRSKKATKKTQASALGWVSKLTPRGGTNIHDALELAFEDDEVDTIYLLSDGQPGAGKITDPTELANAVARWNKTRRIRIHTIAIGSKSELMERLAKESGGSHVHVR